MNITILGYASLIFMLFVLWSCRQNARKQREKFKRELQGYKFGSWKELRAHWRGQLDFSLDGEFDPNRHGSLLETLKTIDEAATKEWIRWNS